MDQVTGAELQSEVPSHTQGDDFFVKRTNSEGESNIAVARFLDVQRRITQERVPTASNVGSRVATWASQLTALFPFRVFSRVSRAPFLLLFKILFASFCKG